MLPYFESNTFLTTFTIECDLITSKQMCACAWQPFVLLYRLHAICVCLLKNRYRVCHISIFLYKFDTKSDTRLLCGNKSNQVCAVFFFFAIQHLTEIDRFSSQLIRPQRNRDRQRNRSINHFHVVCVQSKQVHISDNIISNDNKLTKPNETLS